MKQFFYIVLFLLACFATAQMDKGQTPTKTISYADEMANYMEALGLQPEITSLFQEAHVAWNAKKYAETETVFQQLDTVITDKMPQARAFLELNRGLVALEQKQFDVALSHYQKAADIVPNWWLIEAHIAEAHALQRGDDEPETVSVQPYRAVVNLPLLSIILFVVSIAIWRLSFLRRTRRFIPFAVLLTTGAALAFPLFTPTPNPFARHALPSTEEASSLLDSVLTNTYRAFIAQDENAVYDRLDVSVTGDTLREIYLQNRASVQIQAADNTTMRIDDVNVSEVKNVEAVDGGLAIHANWQVSGFVRHFGHLHYRRNAYEAIVTVLPIDGVWKISHISLIQEEQLL